MIHFFDGFNWPVDAAMVGEYQPPSSFLFPDNPYRHPENGKGLVGVRGYSSNNGASAAINAVSRPSIKFSEGRIVVGGAIRCSQQHPNNFIAFIMCFKSDNVKPTAGASSSTYNFAIEPTKLPSLLIHGTTLYLRSTNLRSPTATSYGVASRELTGVSLTFNHWYEVVYDTTKNTIEVFIDDVSVLVHPYTFSDVEKAAEYVLAPHVLSFGPYSHGVFNVMYAANERLGPCKVVAKYASSDVNVPAAFGTGPHYAKLNGGFAAGDAQVLSTKEDAVAEFGLNGESIVSDVKALSIYGRLSSTNRSAYETEAKIKYGLKLPQGTWSSSDIDVPVPSIAPQKIDQLVVQNNPLTGAPFTKEEVNALVLSLAFDITNKF